MKSAVRDAVSITGIGLCLLGANWLEQRGDERRTGATTEPLPPPVAQRWAVDLGAPVEGEPVVDGCTIAVTTSVGTTFAFNARNGQLLWQDAPAFLGAAPEDAHSSLAFSGGELFAGIPVDPAIPRLRAALDALSVGCEAYAVDNNLYPPGPELATVLIPTYVSAMPLNPATGLVMKESEVASPGEYRYRYSNGATRDLAMWWSDGSFLPAVTSAWGSCGYSPPPPWPESPTSGGTPTTFDAKTGAVLARETNGPAFLFTDPLPLADGALWGSVELASGLGTRGRLRRIDSSGVRLWEKLLDGPAIAGALRDAVSGWFFAAVGAGDNASQIGMRVRAIATACEAYAVDNNLYPATGDVAGVLTPTYTKCLPMNLYESRNMHWSPTPSPGDYDYAAVGGLSYEVSLWNSAGQKIARFENGAFTDPAVDPPPHVLAVDQNGFEKWKTPVAPLGTTITSPILLPGDRLAVGSCTGDVSLLSSTTGAVLATRSTGKSLSRPPTWLSSGYLVFVTDDGEQCWFDGPLLANFGCWPNGGLAAAPVTGVADGTLTAKPDGRLRGERFGPTHTIWDLPFGGISMRALVTAPVVSNGWVYVVRSDGRLLALADGVTGGSPPDPGPVLRAAEGSFGSVVLSWSGATSSGAPGEHLHLERRPTAGAVGAQVLPHPTSPTSFVDGAPPADAFWVLHAADCGENESR